MAGDSTNISNPIVYFRQQGEVTRKVINLEFSIQFTSQLETKSIEVNLKFLLLLYRALLCLRPHRAEALSDDARLTSVCLSSDGYLTVCLSVAYIGPKSRTERTRKTRIGTEVAHVTRDSDTTFKVKRSTCRGRPGHIVMASRTAC